MAAVTLILKALAEIGVIFLLLRGLINENKLVKFEKKIFKVIKTLRQKRRIAQKESVKENDETLFASEYETERKSSSKRKSKKGNAA